MNGDDTPTGSAPGQAAPEEPLDAMTAELHALVDGQLPLDRVEAVLTHLRSHPADALRMAEWQAQRLALRQWHRSIDAGPTPPAMLKTLEQTQRSAARSPWAWRSMAAAAGLLLLVTGGLGGTWWASSSAGLRGSAFEQLSRGSAPQRFVREAVLAHAVYTPESRHPVEVGAAEEAHLVTWLSRRLGSPLKAPALQAQGFRLLGGRLLPGEASPRAQFMYEDARGRRLTLYVTGFGADEKQRPRETAFRSFSEGPIESFYWIEGSFGYALSAQLPAAEVMALAREVYRQLSPG